jgi:hypothetical protein
MGINQYLVSVSCFFASFFILLLMGVHLILGLSITPVLLAGSWAP